MKTATITYHWMPNYGAVLQTYALQQYLHQNEIDNLVIDYVPRRIKWRSYIGYFIRKDWDVLRRVYPTRKFVKKEIKTTDKRYRNHRELYSAADKYQAYICGSDQIWCEWFIKNAEKEYTLSYYLDFVNTRKKIAYAVSFGTTNFTSKEVEKEILKNIKTFSYLGMRELEGQAYVEKKGISAELVCDPVFLLNPSVYEELANKSVTEGQNIFKFILHNRTKLVDDLIDHYDADYKLNECKKCKKKLSVYDWLKKIRDSELIITDSFHCMAFSIIFHKKFIVVSTSEKGFDSRMITTLSKIGLEDRMCTEVKNFEEIDWSKVQEKLLEYRDESRKFLDKCLKEEL